MTKCVFSNEDREALKRVMSEDEIKALLVIREGGTIAIGFMAHGVFTQHGEPQKAEAIAILEDRLRMLYKSYGASATSTQEQSEKEKEILETIQRIIDRESKFDWNL